MALSIPIKILSCIIKIDYSKWGKLWFLWIVHHSHHPKTIVQTLELYIWVGTLPWWVISKKYVLRYPGTTSETCWRNEGYLAWRKQDSRAHSFICPFTCSFDLQHLLSTCSASCAKDTSRSKTQNLWSHETTSREDSYGQRVVEGIMWRISLVLGEPIQQDQI